MKRFNLKYLAIAIIIIASFGVYFNTLWNEFVYDDNFQVLENPFIKDIRNIPKIFTVDLWSFKGEGLTNFYRPLIHIIYMIDYYIFGLKPWGFHLTNIIFHTGVSILVFLIALRILNLPNVFTQRGNIKDGTNRYLSQNLAIALTAGVLFTIHPIHTEVVAWAGCPESHFTFFYLLSFYLYATSLGGKTGRYILSVIFFFIALLSKETAVTLPLLLFAYDYLIFKGYPIQNTEAKDKRWLELRIYIPYLFAAVIYFIIRTYVVGGFAPSKRHLDLSNYEYIINIFPLFVQYLEKLILPINLNAFYVLHPISSVLEWKGLITVGISLLFAYCGYLLWNKNKPALFCLIWIVIPLLPVFYIPALGENTFTERYLYLPSAGFVILSAIYIGKTYQMRLFGNATLYAMFSIFIVVTILYSVGTIKRNYIWRNDLTLWTDTVRKTPDAPIVHNNLGFAYKHIGRLQEAIEEYQMAIRLKPGYGLAYNNLGNVYENLGRLEEAVEAYQTAIRLNPNNSHGHHNLGNAYIQLGRLQEAMEEYQEAIRLKPGYSLAHYNIGRAYAELGYLDKAIEEYLIAIRLEPDYELAYNNLGTLYDKLGRLEEAVEAYKKVTRLNPDYEYGYYNLGNAYIKLGRLQEAIEEYQEAIRLNPGYSSAHYNIGRAYAELGNLDSAIEEYQMAIRLEPTNEIILFNLGLIYEKKGLTKEAIKIFTEVLKIKPDFTEASRGIDRLK